MSKNSPLDADFANIFFKPIAQYLNNPETSEIMVNACDDIWVEDNLGLRKVPETFTPDALVSAVNSLAQYVGRPLIENVYSIDARMPDGSRVCIVLPPVSGHDPIFSIRKFKEIVSDLDFLVKKGSLTTEMVDLIDACVKIKKNMMVAGGTSSGKTTLLNLIAAKIPDHDRIITIEDSRELQLKQEHVLALEAKPADKHGKGEFSIRQCLKSSLRLRPDRIVVGEIRGGEAFDLIQAMNTGHGGCMGTVHANTPTDTLRRLESLSLTADIDMPIVALRAMIASALDLVISPARLSDGSRRIIQIAEIGPLTEKGDYQTFDIARYVSTHRDKNTGKIEGYFEFTGHVPSFFEMFEAEGVDVPIEFFRKRVSGSVPEREIPKLLEKGYEIPGRAKPEPSYTAIKAPLPEPVISQAPNNAAQKLDKIDALTDLQYTKTTKEIKPQPITQQIIPIDEQPANIEPIIPINQLAESFNFAENNKKEILKDEYLAPAAPAQDEYLTTNNFEEEQTQDEYLAPTAPAQDEYLTTNNFEEEQVQDEYLAPTAPVQDEYSITNNFEEEQTQDDYLAPTAPVQDDYSTTNNFEEEQIEANIQETNSALKEPVQDEYSATNSFQEEIPQSPPEEFIPQRKTIEEQPPKRPSLLERLSKISSNSAIPIVESSNQPTPPISAFEEEPEEESPQLADNSFSIEEEPAQPEFSFEEPEESPEPQQTPIEEQEQEEKPIENKQHVVIAEILRRMRENRSNNA